jgi:deoxycytidylate deaminase
MICNSGIKTIIYRYEYDKFSLTSEIKEMIERCGIQLIPERDL